jgi:hypothetical protein
MATSQTNEATTVSCQSNTKARRILALIDADGRPLSIAEWAEMLEVVLEGVTERLDAARDDIRSGK